MSSTNKFSPAELEATRRLARRLQMLAQRLQDGQALGRLTAIYAADAGHLHDKLVQYGNVFEWYLSLDDDNAAIFLSTY